MADSSSSPQTEIMAELSSPRTEIMAESSTQENLEHEKRANVKTCHQCRQKTLNFVGSCKNIKKADKLCTIRFCHKCLLNRYGEKAEEVAILGDWICPKCRGICNCSLCMKKRGHQPTGIFVNKAKAAGFSSVSEMLQVKGFDFVDSLKAPSTSPITQVGEKDGVASLMTRGKENMNGNDDAGSSPRYIVSDESPNRVNGQGLLENNKETIHYCENDEGEEKGSKSLVREVPNGSSGVKKKEAGKSCISKKKKIVNEEIRLPEGAEITKVAGVDVPAQDVGPALQFLEFCSTFEEVLDVKKGEPASVLRDLFRGRSGRSGSAAVQFQIKLLKLILGLKEDQRLTSSSSSSGGSSWLEALRECASESKFLMEDLPADIFEKEDGYNELETSKKLKLLTFICDQSLGSVKLRNWIAEQHGIFAERKKQAREKLLAAEDKEKHTKMKMQDEIAKALQSGAPLSIPEHEAIVSEMKTEVESAHAESRNKELALKIVELAE
ncbi:Zinc-finger domain of monoamine-oxidase A repressor R1 [Dillenia turbinata]|uniref:Zinc-finger domain of monoamine-oxidase A repressor R1 n=1 Tax=Dillenia turbinata TaxID=194707 RepID=A0AAN8V3Z7_9MAGN